MSEAVALGLLALFGGLVFGIQELRHRRVGGTSWVDPGLKGARERAADALFVVAGLLCVAGPVLALAGVLGAADAPVPLQGLGVALALAGTILARSAQRTMGASWRTGVAEGSSERLVSDGAFAAVRNPVYTGLVAAVAGAAVVAPTVPGIAGALLFAAALQVQVRVVEEPHLLDEHGERYRTYAARAGRFLPGLGRMS